MIVKSKTPLECTGWQADRAYADFIRLSEILRDRMIIDA